LATGGTSGVFYPLGGGIATVLSNNVDGLNCQSEATGASVENGQLLRRGEVDLSIIQNDIAYYTATGTELEAYEDGPSESIKGISVLYPDTIQVVALADSGIESIEDLAGKRVATGSPGSGVEANARQVLAAYDMTFDDLHADPLSFSEAGEQMRNEQIDAAFLTAAVPNAAITEVASVTDITVLPISDEAIERLMDEYPFYTEF